jgi:hypothetical protein
VALLVSGVLEVPLLVLYIVFISTKRLKSEAWLILLALFSKCLLDLDPERCPAQLPFPPVNCPMYRWDSQRSGTPASISQGPVIMEKVRAHLRCLVQKNL